MLQFMEQRFYLKPVKLSSKCYRFDVYKDDGTYVGDNIAGIIPMTFDNPKTLAEFEELVQDNAQLKELRIVVMNTYGVSLEEITGIPIGIETIISEISKQSMLSFEYVDNIIHQYA